MLTVMVAKFKYYLTVVFGVLALIGYAFVSGRKSGKQEVQAQVKEQEIATTKQVSEAQVQSATVSKKVAEDVSRSSDSDVDSELSKFTRD